jgi:hypothetical protein
MDNEFNLKELPYYSKLLEVRKYFEANTPEFKPYGNCHPAARLVSQVTGLKEVAGDFVCNGLLVDHGWNYDTKRKLFLDIMHDQFNASHPILAVSSSDTRYKISPIRSFFEWLGPIDIITGESTLRLSDFFKWRKQNDGN